MAQMMAGAGRMGLSPGWLDLPKSAELSRHAGFLGLSAVLCRYVNSQLPPIVASKSHVWLIVGYTLSPGATGQPPRLWRHDDARGPYLPVRDPWQEQETAHAPWQFTILPLLPKIYLTAERAEAAGRFWFESYVASPIGGRGMLAKRTADDDITYRTYAVRSRAFKEGLARRGMDGTLVRLYQFAHLPRYLWVVEALSRRDMNGSGRARAVLGETIFDATEATPVSGKDPTLPLALHGDDFVYQAGPDHREAIQATLGSAAPYLSGLPAMVG